VRYLISTILIVSIALLMVCCQQKSPESKKVESDPSQSSEISMIGKAVMPEEEDLLRGSALNGDTETVKKMLEKKVNVNALDPDGRSALMLASFNGHLEIVRELIKTGADVNMQDANGRTALMFASSGPFPATVEALLTSGADPNITDYEEHFTALMYAAAEGQTDVVKLLLQHGSDKSLTDIDGDNALSFARENGHAEVVDLLGSGK